MTDSRLQTPRIVSDLAATWRSYLPEHVLQLLLSATNVDNPPVTEPVDAVLLYADVAGFTAMTECLSSAGSFGTEQLTRIINQWPDGRGRGPVPGPGATARRVGAAAHPVPAPGDPGPAAVRPA